MKNPQILLRIFRLITNKIILVNFCLCYLAFLQKGSKTLWKEGTFFLLRSRSMPFAKGERCSFLCTKEKSQKKCATLQVDRSANQRSRKGLFAPERTVRFGGLHLYPKARLSEFRQPRRFCKFDWRVGA